MNKATDKIYTFTKDGKEVATVYIFGNGSIRWKDDIHNVREWLLTTKFSELKDNYFFESSTSNWFALPRILENEEFSVSVESMIKDSKEKPQKIY